MRRDSAMGGTGTDRVQASAGRGLSADGGRDLTAPSGQTRTSVGDGNIDEVFRLVGVDSPVKIPPLLAIRAPTQALIAAHALSEADAARAAQPQLPDDVPPVEKFSPSPGIWITRRGTKLEVKGLMKLSGAEATPELAKSLQDAINRIWTRDFGDQGSISCNVIVFLQDDFSPWPILQAGPSTKIILERSNVASNFHPALKQLTVNLNELTTRTIGKLVAHEFGHALGTDDKYDESFLSSMASLVYEPWRGKTIPKPGIRTQFDGCFPGELF
jgi:hypothetical protein